jgi:hypothetical protein
MWEKMPIQTIKCFQENWKWVNSTKETLASCRAAQAGIWHFSRQRNQVTEGKELQFNGQNAHYGTHFQSDFAIVKHGRVMTETSSLKERQNFKNPSMCVLQQLL